MTIKNLDSLLSSIEPELVSLKRDALEAYAFALTSVIPENILSKRIKFDGEKLYIAGKNYSAIYTIKDFEKIFIVGAGKASYGMGRFFEKILGEYITEGAIIVPKNFRYEPLDKIKIFEGTHPIPSSINLEATKEILNILKNVDENTLILFLLSGGASALFFKPINKISLEDYNIFLKKALKSGMNIIELNCIRKHLSEVKGGKFLMKVYPAKVASIVISDVMGNRLDSIGSGPTYFDSTTFEDAYKILKKYNLWNDLPVSIREVIEDGLSGKIEETLKPGDKSLENVSNIIISDNEDLCISAKNFLEKKGYKVKYLSDTPMIGIAREFSNVIYRYFLKTYNSARVGEKWALIFGGETTVEVVGDGIGGRCQEMCLSISKKIRGFDKVVFLAAGSDGIDGNSPAAGCIIDSKTVYLAEKMGLEIDKFLERNDSYTFLKAVNSAIVTGWTGTNVNDIAIILFEKTK